MMRNSAKVSYEQLESERMADLMSAPTRCTECIGK